MARSKNHALASSAVLALLLSLCASISNADSEWTTLTSYGEVRRFRAIRDTLYLATSGGLLAITDPNAPGQVFNNLNGLGTVDITDVIEDTSGQIWVAGFGRIVKFTRADSRQYLFLDNANKLFAVNRIVDDGDHLWVGTHQGLALFSKTRDGGQIEDSYGLFNSLTPFPDVFDIYITRDTIWLATSAGLAVANKRVPNLLKSPLNWETFDVARYPSLGSDQIHRVLLFESDLYMATNLGLYRMNRSGTNATFSRIPFGQGVPCSDLRVEHDTLFVYSDSGLAVIKSRTVTPITPDSLKSRPLRAGIRSDHGTWLGVRGGGIWHESGGLYRSYQYTGMPTNDVAEVTVNRRGELSIVYTWNGVAQYVNNGWRHTRVNTGTAGLDSAFAISAMSDPSGDVWFGTWGRGLWHVADSGAVQYTESNSALSSVPENRNHVYIVVRGLANDGRYLYAICYRGRGPGALVAADMTQLDNRSRWTTFGFSEGITDTMLVSVDCSKGYVVVGTEGNGVFRYFMGPDPFVRTDDTAWHYTASKGLLRSDVIRVVKFSVDGDLWVGTNFGLSRFDPLRGRDGLFADVDLPEGIGPDITDLEFDGRGNLWIATHNGLALREAATGQYTVFTTLNSGLVVDDIRKIAFDRVGGNLYIATGSGVSVLSSTYGTPTDVITRVSAFPNPFVIRSQDDKVEFNYSGAFNLRIYTMAGDLVRESHLQSWDGRSQSGELVASGIYLYVLTSPDGATGRGKLLLIRQ